MIPKSEHSIEGWPEAAWLTATLHVYWIRFTRHEATTLPRVRRCVGIEGGESLTLTMKVLNDFTGDGRYGPHG